ncbi:hypothetical protein BDY19DRAFT_585927 [Irpex rosettiformis]|uniref:Uncharacterized protein n=1 Tax=Irpex rosettiformis TaxID=378272 RepID=A0ACB8UD85_9APHY|nr:hypothetical protein BDY19DRAFT_585927 [Irpex rosettiformis]
MVYLPRAPPFSIQAERSSTMTLNTHLKTSRMQLGLKLANPMDTLPGIPGPSTENIILLVDESALIGAFIVMLLTGVGLAQVYYYSNEYSEDNLWTKGLVWLVLLLGLLQSVCVCMVTYRSLITVAHDTNFADISKILWTTPV